MKFLDIDHPHALLMAKGPLIQFVHRASNADLDAAFGIKQALFHGPTKGHAMVQFGAEIIITGVTMGIEMDQTQRPLLRDGPQDRQSDGMIASRRQRCDAPFVHLGEKSGDFIQGAFQLERFFNPGIAQISHRT